MPHRESSLARGHKRKALKYPAILFGLSWGTRTKTAFALRRMSCDARLPTAQVNSAPIVMLSERFQTEPYLLRHDPLGQTILSTLHFCTRLAEVSSSGLDLSS